MPKIFEHYFLAKNKNKMKEKRNCQLVNLLLFLMLCVNFAHCQTGQLKLSNDSKKIEEDSKPNILFILADDVGQEVLSCYGGESYHTPNIDELARTGMRFKHAYSMPTCVPSRLTIMTGKYPVRFGETKWGEFPKSAEKETFSNLLQEEGYATGIAGKWQMCERIQNCIMDLIYIREV